MGQNQKLKLETKTDNIIDPVELQLENSGTVRDSAPRVSAYSFPRFNNAYTRRSTFQTCGIQYLNLKQQTGLNKKMRTLSTLQMTLICQKVLETAQNKLSILLPNYVSLDRLSANHKRFIVSLNSIFVPNVVTKVMPKKEWRDAVKVNMDALEKNVVDCKWIFTIKYKADGFIERQKARLVAMGYTQAYGIDYQETFAPVAKMNIVRSLLYLATHFD